MGVSWKYANFNAPSRVSLSVYIIILTFFQNSGQPKSVGRCCEEQFMFPFISFLRPEFPLYFFDDILIQGPGVRIPRPPYTNQQFRDTVPKPPNLAKQQSQKKNLEQFTPQQGQYWGILGDQALENQEYTKAIEHYTKAIEITDGSESQFFRGRGEANKLCRNLQEALKDAIQAIELDDKNIKAHLLCGQVLAEIGKYDNSINHIQTAIVRLTKALTLCAGQKKQYYESELSKYIYRAKKLLWYKQQEIVNKQKREAILNYSKYIELRDNLSPEEKKVEVNNFISSIGDPDRPFNFEIPSYLICKITLELMENPVTTDAGISYERDVLVEAIEKNGPIDPTTRQPISRELYPNQNIKQAIQYFLLNNPWAFEYESGEDYHNIKF